jgi:tetratricopeptide (TPR) repeat protein/tRNA A-37 threonylcarbamoyl transferase component Bud32
MPGEGKTRNERGNREVARTPAARVAPGELLAGRYRVVRFIAAGGMGDVYEVEDETLKDRIALKTIRADFVNDEAAMTRFRREIQLARKITHPNVCRTFDIGAHEETTFLTMELLDGQTLSKRLRATGPMGVEAALPLVRQLIAALGAAHAASVVHRDFKAENVVLVPDGKGGERAVVTDFGLARGVGDAGAEGTNVTGLGVMVGTPATMAPEQMTGGAIGPPTDLYALGAVLFQMVTGRMPFEGSSAMEVASKRLVEDAPRASSVVPELDPRWDAAIARCLEREPAARFARAEGVLAALESTEVVPATGLVSELRRRRVFRVATAYAVGAFALLQVADLVSEPLGLPRWGMTALIAAAAIGFPIAMVLAWVFDVTSKGIVRTRGPRRRAAAVIAGVLGVAAVGAVVAVLAARHRPGDARAVDLGPQIAVIVGDVANDTRDPDLDGLSGLLTTALDQSPRLSVLSHSRVLDLLRGLGKPGDARIDEELGRELCRHAGVRVLVLSSIRRFDQVYAAELKVLDVQRGTYVLAVKEQAEGKANIPSLIDRLSEATRAGLNESAADIAASTQPVASVTTSNLEAYRYYYDAERTLYVGGAIEPQIELLEKAVAIDPTFALAWWRIAYVEEWGHKGSEAQLRAMRAAIENVERAPPRERLLIRAWDAHLRKDDDAAAALYDRAIAEHEPDKALYFLAGDLHFHLQQHARALPLLQKAIAMDPSMAIAFDHAVESLAILGRNREAMALARTAPPGWQAVEVGFLLLDQGDIDGARKLLEPPIHEDLPSVREARVRYLTTLELWAGRPDAARRWAEEGAALGVAWGAVPWAVALEEGKFEEFRRGFMTTRQPDTALETDVALWIVRHLLGWQEPVPAGDHLEMLMMWSDMMRSDFRLARAIAIEDYPAAIVAARTWGPAYAGELPIFERLAEGDTNGALSRLSALTKEPISADVLRMRLLVLAQLATRAGKPAEALAALDRLKTIYPEGAASFAVTHAPSLHLAGRAHEALGDHRAAAASYRALLALWKNADRNIPILLDAKARLARLGG